jgi:hypothetical protein
MRTESRIDLSSADAGYVPAQGIRQDGLGLDDVPLALVERVLAKILRVEAPAARPGYAQNADICTISVTPPGGCEAIFRLGREGAEILFEDEVHHPLIGGVAIAKRHFLGHDVDALDRFRWQVPDFRETGDAAAVDQHNGPATAPPPVAAGLRGERLDQFGDAASAQRPDFLFVELNLGRDVAVDLAAQALPDDHDGPLLQFFFVNQGIDRIDLRRCRLLLGVGGSSGGAAQQRQKKRSAKVHFLAFPRSYSHRCGAMHQRHCSA